MHGIKQLDHAIRPLLSFKKDMFIDSNKNFINFKIKGFWALQFPNANKKERESQ